MTDRRTFVSAGAAALLTLPLGAAAQRDGRLPRIGLLAPGSSYMEASFLEGMRDLGYVEGKNIAFERRFADGDFTRLPALAAELVKQKPDIIVAIVSAAAIAASQATTTIPIVMVGVADPIASGLVGNLARPGRNVTGTSSQSNATVGKQVELVRQLLPDATRAAVLWNPANAVFQQLMLGEGLIAAARLRILARILEARTPEEVDRAFDSLKSERPDVVLVLSDPFFTASGTRIANAALALRMPVVGATRPLVEAGVLAGYGPDLRVVARRAAPYVQRILKGEKPGQLAVELPTKFDLVINMKTAGTLGVTVSPTLLARADEVIR
jgi:ABC-type uncharacterized transport system substrate-binding protein